MARIHLYFIEDEDGDLKDVLYWHHECAAAEGMNESSGWPCLELEQDVQCEGCYKVINRAGRDV